MKNEYVKIVIFTPVTHGDKIRKVLADNNAGKLGEYDSCSFTMKGIGRFRPLSNANPFIGEIGKIEEVEEERIETICLQNDCQKILEAVKEVHPYDEPAIDVYPLLNL